MGQSSEVNDHKSSSSALRGDAPGCEPADELIVERHGGRVSAKWNIARFAQHNKGFKVIYSKYFEVGGYDCRLLVYPTGMHLNLMSSIFRPANSSEALLYAHLSEHLI